MRPAHLAALLAGAAVLAAPATASGATTKIELKGRLKARGTYTYLPFTVPAGTRRVAATVSSSNRSAKFGFGLYDQRGTRFGSPGFRGIYGEERKTLFVSAAKASPAFVAGPIKRGRWTIALPVYAVGAAGAPVTAKVTLTSGKPETPAYRREPVPETVTATAGWYRGDLHAHTTASSDAANSKKALSTRGLAQLADRRGLDFLSLTDHNVSAQNDRLRSASPQGFLLLAGEEVTTWFAGHLTVSGLTAATTIDWRARPIAQPQGGPTQARIGALLQAARKAGAYVAAAHPELRFGGNGYDFFAESDRNAALLPDGLEAWNGALFGGDDAISMQRLDREVARGRQLAVNGGSDVHGVDKGQPGDPTTVVYGPLSRKGVVSALKLGRSYITESPTGPQLGLSARGPGGQQEIVGGRIIGGAGDVAQVAVQVKGGASSVLTIKRDGLVVKTMPIASADETVTLDTPIGAGGAVRAELTKPDATMRALTNPLLLRNGPVPSGPVTVVAPLR